MPAVRTAGVVIGASVAGASHARASLPCQDAFASARLPDGIAFAVADGLGSASLSHRGARAAVDAAIASAESAETMVDAARAALERIAGEEDLALSDLACTLIAVTVRDGVARSAHVGDGAAIALVGDGPRMLSGPARSEYVNVVDPLTADDWRTSMRTARAEGVRALAVFTDGCERAALGPSGEPHPGFFEPLFAFAARAEDAEAASGELAALLAGEKMSEHSDDDKTLVIAWLSTPLP